DGYAAPRGGVPPMPRWPASPETSTTWPSPALVRAQRRSSRSISSSRRQIAHHQGQLATEDRQIIRRSLDRDFPFGRALGPPATFRAMPGSEDRLDGFEVQWRATAVNEGVKHLSRCPPTSKTRFRLYSI